MDEHQRKSRAQEKRIAKRRGEKLHSGSGSGRFMRNDMHGERYWTECKRTDNKKYIRLDVKEIEALIDRAARRGLIAKLEIEINGCEYVLLTNADFEELDRQ